MSVFHNNMLVGASQPSGAAAFDTTLIGNSIWLEGTGTSGDSASRNWGSESNQDRWIWATWYQPLRIIDAVGVRNNIFTSGSASNGFYLRHNSTDSSFNVFHRDNAGTEGAINTTESYRDVASWIHLLIDYDSANANAEDRICLYINGVRTGVNSGNRPGQNNHLNTNVSGQTAKIGVDLSPTPNYHTKGYLAQTVFLDNKSIVNDDLAITDFLDTFTFGTHGSQIIPKSNTDIIALASAAGNNSFCLDYSDADNIVNDASSKGNNFSTSTISSANQSISTPSKTYSVFNPIAHADNSYPGAFTLSDGNQKNVINSSNTSVKTTLPFIMSGSNIIRTQFTFPTVGHGGCGITSSRHTSGTYHTNADSIAGNGEVALLQNGALVIDGTFNNSYFGGLSNGDVVDVIVNCDAGAVYFAVNGTLLSSATQSEIQAGTTTNAALTGGSFVRRKAGEVFNFYAVQFNPTSTTIEYNSGQSSFTHSYSNISSLKSLNTADLPAPEYQGIDYFDSTLYEGNGGGQRVGDFVPVTDVGTITKSFLADGRTNSGTTDLTIAHTVSTSPTNVQVKTLSFWIKPVDVDQQYIYSGSPTSNDSTDSSERIFVSSTGQVIYNTRNSGSAVVYAVTGNVINDSSQWTNVVVALNYASGVSSASDRLKIYINGVLQTLGDGGSGYDTAPAENMTGQAYINAASTRQLIGTHPGFTSSANRSNVYLAEMYMVDGQSLDASTFGVLDTSTNRWVPKAPDTIKSTITGTGDGFGNCGFYLDFLDASDLGDDDSGNTRDFTESATIGTANQSNDSPSINFAVMNPGDQDSSTATTLSEGNLKVSMGTSAGDGIRGTLPYNGKMYWEVEIDAIATNSGSNIGIATSGHNLALTSDDTAGNGQTNAFVGISSFDSNVKGFIHGSPFDTAYGGLGNNFGTAGKFLMFAVDIDAGKFWAGYDGTFFNSGNPAAGTNDSGIDLNAYTRWFPAITRIGSAGSEAFIFNFGQRSFAHTAPTGYSSLNQDNLDDTASKLTAWAWIKNRDSTDSHVLIDRIRGVGVEVHTDGTTTTPETTNANTVQGFLQRGLQVGNDVQVNTANESYVLWQWLVGSSATTGTANSQGSLNSTVLAADAGHFSVVSWTGNETAGATVGHGMGGEPEVIIAIARAESGENKPVYHPLMTSDNNHLKINEVNAQGTAGTTIWDVSAMSSTVIGLGAAVQSNSNNGMIAYCFRSVHGVCKVGSYIPNNEEDGPYVNLGFTPAMIFLKCRDTTNPWMIFDNARDGSLSSARNVDNAIVRYLNPNSTAAEAGVSSGTGRDIDFLSDGFKIREDDSDINGGTSNPYIFVAMAEIGGNGTLPPIYGR